MRGPEKPTGRRAGGDGRLFRVDLIIATLALLASACASIATVVQTRTIANQLSASVWPYLTFSISVGPHALSADIRNEGLGPALVRTFAVTLDRHEQSRLRDVIRQVDRNESRTATTSDFGGGSVIRPSETFTVFRVEDSHLDAARAQALLRRADAAICYCSLLGNCWSLDTRATEPQAVQQCGRPTPRLSY